MQMHADKAKHQQPQARLAAGLGANLRLARR